MDLGAPVLDVQSQKAGDSSPVSIVKDGEVTFNKVDGKTKPDWIAALTVAEVEEFLCKNMAINLAYKDASATTTAPFSGCKLIGSDFSELTLQHSISESSSVILKRNSIITQTIQFKPSSSLNGLKIDSQQLVESSSV